MEGGDETSAGEEEEGEELDFPLLQRSVKKRQDRRPTPEKSVPASATDHPSAEGEGAFSMDTEEETEEGGESEREATRDEGGEKEAGSSEAATRAGAETRDERESGRRLTDWLSVSQPNPSTAGLVRRQVRLSQQAPIIVSITPPTNPGNTHSDDDGTAPRSEATNVIVHPSEPKSNWEITKVRTGTRTLIVADSQFRNITGLPCRL